MLAGTHDAHAASRTFYRAALGSLPPSGAPPEGHMLASNLEDQTPEWINVWEEPDALADIAFVAGVLGLFAGLMAVVRLSGSRFPDALFWRVLPLLLVLPPAVFLSPLLAPGGLSEGGSSGWLRAARLGLSGLASYVAPVILLSIVAALACLR